MLEKHIKVLEKGTKVKQPKGDDEEDKKKALPTSVESARKKIESMFDFDLD